jgi:hypothetical protein
MKNYNQWDSFWNLLIKEDMLLFDKNGNKPTILTTNSKYKSRFKHGNKIENHIKSIIQEVKDGTTKDKGVVYMMYYLDNGRRVPLYIGKSEFKGRKRKYSANATNLNPAGPFLRWGSRPDYHLGDLYEAYRGNKSTLKYEDWNNSIFDSNGEFKKETYLTMTSLDKMKVPIMAFPTSVTQTESTLITWAGHLFPNDLLNRDGKERF